MMSPQPMIQKILLAFLWITLWVPRAEATPILKVGVVNAKPFSWQEGKTFRGIAIDLWEQTAQKNGWKYEYVALDPKVLNIDFYLLDPSVASWDVLIGPVSKTEERESSVNLSAPYFLNQIDVVQYDKISVWQATLMKVLMALPYRFFWLFLGVIFLFSMFLNWVDGRHKGAEQFDRHHHTFISLLTAIFMPGVSSEQYVPTIPMKLVAIAWSLFRIVISISISIIIVEKVLNETLLGSEDQSLDVLKGKKHCCHARFSFCAACAKLWLCGIARKASRPFGDGECWHGPLRYH